MMTGLLSLSWLKRSAVARRLLCLTEQKPAMPLTVGLLTTIPLFSNGTLQPMPLPTALLSMPNGMTYSRVVL